MLFDAWLRVERQPIESLLATFGFDRSMRSGGVIMVFYLVMLSDLWWVIWGGITGHSEGEGQATRSMTS